MPLASPFQLTVDGQEDALFLKMTATEEMGRLFEFDVLMASQDELGSPHDLLGKPASVSVALADDTERHFHGLICAIALEGATKKLSRYRLTLRPWLWLLTRRTDTRIFQEMSMEAIIKKVFAAYAPVFNIQITATLPVYEYCVQYRETDFNFVSRLMEQEGVYYYFKHEADNHTMMIVDSVSAHVAGPHQEIFEYRESQDGQIDFEGITQWRVHKEIQPGKVVLRDYDFKKPALQLESMTESGGVGAFTQYEVYDYPGLYVKPADGTRYSKIRAEEHQASFSRAEGSGLARGLACGYRFTLSEHPREDQNAAYVVVSSRIECTSSGYETSNEQTSFTCQFTAIDGAVPFRSRRTAIKPLVQGVHTALVVGPAADEIHTDEHGRVKVQFHWDRLGKKDDKSSCWIRVATPWAGEAWGMISLPRIGQEVVVDFLEGDPDRPLITGSVYNGTHVPPYALPANKTVSTNKSRSTLKGGEANFNELRFEDKKGSEYVWFQAEKDFHQLVKNDATLHVVGNQERLVDKDQTEQIKGFLKVKVDKDYVKEVKGSHSTKVTEHSTTEATQTMSLKSGMKTDIKAGTDLGVEAVNIHLKGAANVVIEAGAMLTLKVGGSTVVLSPAGVMIVGTMVMINSGGSGGAGGGAKPKAVLTMTPPEEEKDPLKPNAAG